MVKDRSAGRRNETCGRCSDSTVDAANSTVDTANSTVDTTDEAVVTAEPTVHRCPARSVRASAAAVVHTPADRFVRFLHATRLQRPAAGICTQSAVSEHAAVGQHEPTVGRRSA